MHFIPAHINNFCPFRPVDNISRFGGRAETARDEKHLWSVLWLLFVYLCLYSGNSRSLCPHSGGGNLNCSYNVRPPKHFPDFSKHPCTDPMKR
jgi:hypothetical protein